MIPKVRMGVLGHLQLNDVVLLGLIAQGVDSKAELVEASGIAKRTVYRRLLVLTGATHYLAGKGLNAVNIALVESRPHPHQAGKQLALTEEGQRLLRWVGE